MLKIFHTLKLALRAAYRGSILINDSEEFRKVAYKYYIPIRLKVGLFILLLYIIISSALIMPLTANIDNNIVLFLIYFALMLILGALYNLLLYKLWEKVCPKHFWKELTDDKS